MRVEMLGMVVSLLFVGCATIPKVNPPVVSSNDIKDVEGLSMAVALENGKTQMGKLEKSDSQMSVEGYLSPVDFYTLDIEGEKDISITVKSIGNMFGFSKTIMFPVVDVYDEQRNQLEGVVEKYAQQEAGEDGDPVGILLVKKYHIAEHGRYIVSVFADMITNEKVYVMSLNFLVFPISAVYAKKTEYANYRIKVDCTHL